MPVADLGGLDLSSNAQCCIDIGNRIISLQAAQKPRDYYESILRLGELSVLPMDFAESLAPIERPATDYRGPQVLCDYRSSIS